MRSFVKSTRYGRDFRKLKKRGFNENTLGVALSCLALGLPLPPQFKDHPLKGTFVPARECHLGFDLLLVYEIDGDVVRLQRIGSHAEIFGD